MTIKNTRKSIYFCFIALNIAFIGCGGGESTRQLNANSETPSENSSTKPDTFAVQLGALTKKFGRNNFNADDCLDVALDSNKNMYCVGSTYSDMGETAAGNGDAVIVKLSSTGQISWVKQFGTLTYFTPGDDNNGFETFSHIHINQQDKLYVLTHDVNEDENKDYIYLSRLNTNGELLSHTYVGNENLDSSDQTIHSSLAVDYQGNVYVAYGHKIVKYTSDLSEAWREDVIDIPDGVDTDEINHEEAYCDSLTTDLATPANLYCGGRAEEDFIEDTHGPSDAFVIKIDTHGEMVWARQLGEDSVEDIGFSPNGSGNQSCEQIAVNAVFHVFCSGHTTKSNPSFDQGQTDLFLMKLSSSGVIEWIHEFALPTDVPDVIDHQYTHALATKTNGNVVMVGSSKSAITETVSGIEDAFITEFFTDGSIHWQKQFGQQTTIGSAGNNEGIERIQSVVVDDQSNLYLGGSTTGSMVENNADPNTDNPSTDIIMLKLSPTGQL
jgi:hypothetical protein